MANKKDASLMTAILVSFICVILYIDPKLLSYLVGKEPLYIKTSLIIFVISLNMLWLYGLKHFWYFVFAKIAKKGGNYDNGKNNSLRKQPYVAILYLTKNDFNEKACYSCFNQDYKNFKVFICDDSDDEEERKKINKFARKNKIEVIRRGDKKGFKAGNINNALNHIEKKYKYIAVMDADIIVPKDYLKKIIPIILKDEKLAYVQAEQKSIDDQKGEFAGTLKIMTDIHWKYYASLKNRFGFSMWYGHGAVLRRSAIEEIGGIPEVITEDLAFSSEVRRLGYYGIITSKTYTEEEFPENYIKYRRRNRKWIRGTYQYLLRFYPKIFASKNCSLTEKFDIFISAFSLLQVLPFLIMIIIAGFILPEYYSRQTMLGPLFLIPPMYYDSIFSVIFNIRYNVNWGIDLYGIMFVVIFIPLLPALDYIKNTKKFLKYAAYSTFVNLAVTLDGAKEMLAYTFTGKAEFHATNDKKEKGRIIMSLAEEFFGIISILYGIFTYNLWLVSIGAAYTASGIILIFGERKKLKILAPIPVGLTAMIMIFIGLTILQNARIGG